MATEVAHARPSDDQLTPREAEVLELISQGLTNGAIAARLSVSVHTVKFHLGSIYRKMDVSNRTEATSVYVRRSRAEPITRASAGR